MLRKFSLLLAATVFLFAESCPAAERIALVIGNTKYADNAELRNPTHDADAVEAALSELDFEVIKKKDLNLEEMEDAVIEFTRKLGKGRLGLFYYAGHGLQVQGQNYLVPIGARIQEEAQVKHKCLEVDQVLDLMAASECNLKMLVLDSCRNNPFKRGWTRGGSDAGLAGMSDVPSGTIITFSTAKGETAADGTGDNSPFTAELVKMLRRRDVNLEITDLIRQTAQELKKQTGQVPWAHLDITMDKYYLRRSSDGSAPKAAALSTSPPVMPDPRINGSGRKEPTSLIPTDAVVFGGHSYKVIFEPVSWTTAKARCEALGGHLVKITGPEQNDFICQIAHESGQLIDERTGLWIGGTDQEQEGEWKWTDGTPLAYQKWEPTNPNNKFGLEHFALLWLAPAVWVDQPNESNQHTTYVACEWDGLPAGRVQSESGCWVTFQNTASQAGDVVYLKLGNRYDLQIAPAATKRLYVAFLAPESKIASFQYYKDAESKWETCHVHETTNDPTVTFQLDRSGNSATWSYRQSSRYYGR